MPLPRRFYNRDTLTVAERLLGKLLVYHSPEGELRGKIVETEAYVGEEDPACHAARGPTPRNAIMYGPPGHAYVYFTYGMYYMLNVITEKEGFPAAVLIRALEPVKGIPILQRNRGVTDFLKLTSGPGKLCQAFRIDSSLNGIDLCGSRLFVEEGGEKRPKVVWTPRIGISAGLDKLWRCYIAGNRFVSKTNTVQLK